MQEEEIIQMTDKFYKKPNEFINKVQELLENESHNKKGDSLSSIGLFLYRSSYFDLPLHSWKHALKYYIEVGDKEGESNCYGNLGSAYLGLGDYTKAIEYLEKTLEIKKVLR